MDRNVGIPDDSLGISHTSGKTAGAAVGAGKRFTHFLNFWIDLHDEPRRHDRERDPEKNAERAEHAERQVDRLWIDIFHGLDRTAHPDLRNEVAEKRAQDVMKCVD